MYYVHVQPELMLSYNMEQFCSVCTICRTYSSGPNTLPCMRYAKQSRLNAGQHSILGNLLRPSRQQGRDPLKDGVDETCTKLKTLQQDSVVDTVER